MHIAFRPIRPEEISEACSLVDAAYAPQVQEIYGATPRGRWHHYDEAKIISYVERESEGVRIGVMQGKVRTLNICRSYGSLGWFHTLAVHPDIQGRGAGKQALKDAERYLASQGVNAIALMTWPTAVNNLAFYLGQGYQQGALSVYAYRPTETPIINSGKNPFDAQLLVASSRQNQNRTQNAIRALCQKIALGLDYTSWVTWAQNHSFAETLLLWRNGGLQALAISYFLPDQHWAEGKLLLLHPALSLTEQLWALEHLRLWARSRQRNIFGFSVEINTDFTQTALLAHGFRLFPEAMINMVKGGDLPDPAIHFVRFGG